MLDLQIAHARPLNLRCATPNDKSELDRLRRLSLDRILCPRLSEAQCRTVDRYTPFDPALIEDGTYYVLEIDGQIVASGGWSMRDALMRSGDSQQETAGFLCPPRDATAIRAMYTHPDFTRCGLASILLSASETAARIAGFGGAKLIATPTGHPFYIARGWRDVNPLTLGDTDDGAIKVFLMEKEFRQP